jgi:molybdopterin-guanine dinucleotide biosynthesis protein A
MNSAANDVAAFILAGGKSTRMGADKAFVALGGRALLARMLELARSVTPNVRIVGDPAKFAPFAPVVEDVFQECGPLGGIHAALRASHAGLNLILAVDVPFISLALLQFMVTRARNSPQSMITLACSGGRLHPLCAVYRRDFADAAEKALRDGRYRIDALFEDARTQVISDEELEIAGFSPRIFRNLNTPEDLADINE